MIGLPTERTAAEVRKNIDFLIRLDPDYAQIGILSLYPNTQLFEEAAALGLVTAGRWEAWAREPRPGFRVDHWNEFLSDGELVRLHRESYRRFYFRWRYIARSLFALRSLHEFISHATGALKLFFKK